MDQVQENSWTDAFVHECTQKKCYQELVSEDWERDCLFLSVYTRPG